MEEKDIQLKMWKWTAIALIISIAFLVGSKAITYAKSNIEAYIETEVTSQVENAKVEVFSNGVALGKAYAYNETMNYLQNTREDLERQYEDDESYPKWYAVAKSRELIEAYYGAYIGNTENVEFFDEKLKEYVSRQFNSERYQKELAILTQEEREALYDCLVNEDYETLYKLYYKMDKAGLPETFSADSEIMSTRYAGWRWFMHNYLVAD